MRVSTSLTLLGLAHSIHSDADRLHKARSGDGLSSVAHASGEHPVKYPEGKARSAGSSLQEQGEGADQDLRHHATRAGSSARGQEQNFYC